MMAPTLKGFFERWTAMRRGARRRSSSLRISGRGRSNGGTCTANDLVQGATNSRVAKLDIRNGESMARSGGQNGPDVCKRLFGSLTVVLPSRKMGPGRRGALTGTKEDGCD